MRVSKYIKVNRDVLIEYIYDDSNLIGDPYKILINGSDNSQSYIAGDTSGTGNIEPNQLFRIDPINNRYGIVNTDYYSFLQTKDYASGFPVAHDTIKIHIPSNWTFGEYLGFHLKVYTYDYENQKTYDLSSFFFDMTDITKQYLLNYTSPPLLFQEKLWGKNIQIEIPSTFALSAQREDGRAKINSINSNLTNGFGLSMNSPIFIDFSFITKIDVINSITSYILGPKVTTTVPQAPEFEKLGLRIEHSSQGDFFEIYGVYSDSLAEFKQFIDTSFTLGHRYYVEYDITLYEQNIRGRTKREIMTENFNDKIEYRPIIKYSTTTAVIDVEMKLIDAVDNSVIIRRASYGMLQDELSKYSLRMMKINLDNANKPKIYNLKASIDPTMAGLLGINSFGNGSQIQLEPVKVPFPVLIDRFNIVAKSDSVKVKKDTFFGIGKLTILLYPFDNVVKFVLATSVDTNAPDYMDMTNMGEIKLVIKNTQLSTECNLYRDSGEVNLAIGQIVFKIDKNKINDVRRIYDSGVNVFYITSTLQNTTTIVYSGLFRMYDSPTNVNSLNRDAVAAEQAVAAGTTTPSIILDKDLNKETAIVTRKITKTGNANTITTGVKATNLSGIVAKFPDISKLNLK